MYDPQNHIYDVQYHMDEANKYFVEYVKTQEKILKIEADALEAASNFQKAQASLLSDPNSDAAFVYKNFCKNRTTFITLVNMHSNMALMLVGMSKAVPSQREATSKT